MTARTLAPIALALLLVAALCAQTSTLSTEETLKLRVLQLQTQLEVAISEAHACRGELGQWRAKVASAELTAQEATLKAEIEKAHPGFVFDPKTGALTAAPAGR